MLTMTYNMLIKFTFVNKDETLSFSLYLIPPGFGFSSWLPSGLDGLLQSRLQLVILIMVLICSLFVVSNCLCFVSLCCTMTLLMLLAILWIFYFIRLLSWDFPGGAVVENPPASAGDTGSSPGPGRSHMLRSN